MTAEIALLNRRAIAFAADSAVTISDGKSDKIYNSAEKIFQLSFATPLGLMMYNTMEFVGVPIDVLVRRFRTEKDENFESRKMACIAFIDFISSFKRSHRDEVQHLFAIVSNEFCEINKQISTGFVDYFTRWMGNNSGVTPDYHQIQKEFTLNILDEHIQVHLSRLLAGYLVDKDQSDFDTVYGDSIKFAAKHWASDVTVDADVDAKFLELAFAAVKSSIFSDGLTGIIVGGFGKDETFPSLYSIEIDGIFFGRIKLQETYDVDIDRQGERAAIIPFAQSEMVERFLFGIDSSLEKTLLEYVEKTSKAAELSIAASGVDVSGLKINAEEYAQSVQDLLGKLKIKSKKETLDMVDFMPKQELSYAAEDFISLTSVKRRVSAQQETVGGPIDVAIITKNEGFVWIKRKHYFDVGLNPLYGTPRRGTTGETP